ncbi:MAG TPA: serine hydrolase [Candidatus Saccharimonadales bacterium]|nr:serine hydrolase [Candidatus Saccharimonadales bacterium]
MPVDIAEPIVAFALTDLAGRPRDGHLPDRRFYAASTMKVAVLVDVFRRHDAGVADLDSHVTVATTFRSAVDGSSFTIDADDVDAELSARVGDEVSIRYLAERMITVSSNEATNLLLQLSGFEGIAVLLDDLGAQGTVVQRLLDDGCARAAGRDNLVTPADLSRLMTAIAGGAAASPRSCAEMLAILGRQHYQDEIPAALPTGTRVANKTGWVTGILHDTALVWPPDAAPYCLTVCTEGFPDQQAARQAIQQISARVWARREPVDRGEPNL